jgi:Tol biopolymer transport system component
MADVKRLVPPLLPIGLATIVVFGCADATGPGGESDSHEIAFVSEREGDRAVYVMASDGSGLRRLTPEYTYAYPLAPSSWSFDGESLVFDGQYARAEGCPQVHLVRHDGSGVEQLTDDSQRCNQGSSFSPTGPTIAFFSSRNWLEAPGWQVFLMDQEGGGQMAITDGLCSDFPEAWSPDGLSILIARTCHLDVDRDIYRTDLTGSVFINLTRSAASYDEAPSWSPDGSRVAFSSDRDGNREIYVMGLDGGAVTNLTNSPGTDDRSPRWSPDGSMLLYQCDVDANEDLCVMNADGSAQVHLTSGEAASWSPDGLLIAFQSRRTGDDEIYLIAPDGTGVLRLTSSSGFDGSPVWRPYR